MRKARRSMARTALSAGVLALPASGAWSTVVSGRVTDASGQGVANVDLDFIDTGGTSIPLTGDSTDPLGYYAVTVSRSG